MNQTSNYNFNVPVGSDVVNPLVQDFPNWTILDTILRNIANTGITTATHTKSGTIHTLSFSDTTVPMIRFQATADFNTNDTFTVNGLSVSALTVAGESLPDGAFVIGSMVLCELRDNLLTVYSSGSDASTLEGHPASYFATDSDLQIVDDKADANKVLIDQLTSALIWKLQGTVTGSTAISYPSIWSEAYISVTYTGSTNTVYEYTFHILKADVENLGASNYKFYKHGIGGGNTGTFGEICILASTGTFVTLNTLVATSDFLNSATVTMYYR